MTRLAWLVGFGNSRKTHGNPLVPNPANAGNKEDPAGRKMKFTHLTSKTTF